MRFNIVHSCGSLLGRPLAWNFLWDIHPVGRLGSVRWFMRTQKTGDARSSLCCVSMDVLESGTRYRRTSPPAKYLLVINVTTAKGLKPDFIKSLEE
jgi:hypothetical protein